MKKILFLLLVAISALSLKGMAAITVTTASGGTGICSNRAIGGSSPSFNSLGNIVITETLNGDISTGIHTFTINTPTGWQFNAGVTPTVNFTPSRNINFLNVVSFNTTTLTLSFGVTNTTAIDAITISGLQVQATSTSSSAGNITASAAAGMTGITVGVTNFGSLSLSPALSPSVSIAASPAGAICAGTTVTFTATPVNGGSPSYQWFVAGSPVSGATNASFSSNTLANGNSIRVAMTATGCVSPSVANSNIITMSVNPVPAAVTITSSSPSCDTVFMFASLVGPGTIYYQGTTFNGTSTTSPGAIQLTTTQGTYEYYFRARSAAGCWGPQGSTVATVNTRPSALSITPSASAICDGDVVLLAATATAPTVEVMQQNFNAGLGSWTITNIAGTTASYWQLRLPPGHLSGTNGDGSQYLQSAPDATNSSSLPTHTIITSPSFSLVNYSAATLTFNQFYFSFPNDTTVDVAYSIDGGTSWTSILSQAGTSAGSPTWTQTSPNATIPLPSAAIGQSDVRLRWQYNSPWGWYWSIDNVKVNATPILSYTWTDVPSGSAPSCLSCDTTFMTPSATGVNTYTVTTSAAGCSSTATVSITVNPLPTRYNVTGGGFYCSGSTGVNVGLNNSSIGVDYQLYNSTGAVGSPISGTGVAINFGLQTLASSYYVIGTNTSSSCTDTMTGSVSVGINLLPTSFIITGDNTICAGDTGSAIIMAGSATGIRYQLFNGVTPTGSSVLGTGMPVNFGIFNTAGIYDVIATDTATGCQNQMADSAIIIVNPLPVVSPITGTTTLCVGNSTTLGNATAGGSWSSASSAIATINATTGLVNAISAGATIITYSVTDILGCVGIATTGDTVTAIPSSSILPSGTHITLCNGNDANLIATSFMGASYQWQNGSTDIVGATSNAYTASLAGNYRVNINYNSCSWSISKTVLADPVAVINYNTTGNYLFTGTFSSYQWYRNGMAVAGATSSVYTSPIAGSYYVVVADQTGCTDTSATYTVATTAVVTTTQILDVTIFPNPTQSMVYVVAEKPVTITVTSSDGRIVIPASVTNTVDLSSLSNGAYLLIVASTDGTVIKTERVTKIN